jgi:D-psicose/D-tagatose/L-ribulose 3-epimerase
MKYGVYTLIWGTHLDASRAALFSHIREWGFDGAELYLTPQEPADIALIRKILEKNQLECTTCTIMPRECHLISPQSEVRAKGVEFLKSCSDRAAALGSRQLSGALYACASLMTGRRRTPEEWNWAVEGLREAARHAQRNKVTLCLEPLNRFETYFLNTLEDTARMVHDIGEPNVKIHFDTFHANIEERLLPEALRSVAGKVGHVHISENDRGVPGTGHVDWPGVLKALKDTGYTGWLTIESFAQANPELAAESSIWRDVGPSGDELAQQGLRFLQSVAKEVGI